VSPNSILVIVPTCSTHAAALWQAPGMVFHNADSFVISDVSAGEWLLSMALNCSMHYCKVVLAVILDLLIGASKKTIRPQNLFV
jgi:hypothetical protein